MKLPIHTCQIPNLNQIYQFYFPGKYEGFFVEVGAFDGETYSNTSHLADSGWSGIYIEPIQNHYLKCVDRHKDNEVKVLNCSVGSEEKEVSLYVGGFAGELTTANLQQLEIYSNTWWSSNYNFIEEKCNQVRLDTILTEENVKDIDILVVDVEGNEKDIFDSFDLNIWTPKMMIIELVDENVDYVEYTERIDECVGLRKTLENFGYSEIYRDNINTIFYKN
jgi:FkbM family methyltransferase